MSKIVSFARSKAKIIAFFVLALAILLGLLVYYQGQGFIKVFTTSEDRADRKILNIDQSKFSRPEGLSQEKYDQAIARMEEARAKALANPKDSTAWFDFGYYKEFLNDHAGAAAAWEKSYQIQPYNFVVTSNLGNVYQYFIKDFAKSEDFYKKTLEIKPDYTVAYQGLTDLYRYNLKEKSNLLEPLLLDAVQKDSANKTSYYQTLVDYFASSKDWTKAKQYLEQVQRLNPTAAKELISDYPELKS